MRKSTLNCGTEYALKTTAIAAAARALYRDVCGDCGARRIDRQLGLEATPQEYVDNMVEVFRLVRELLADDGTLWLNLGDSYGHGTAASRQKGDALLGDSTSDARTIARNGLAAKQLIGIPWRVAFALQADGWYLRQDIIWSKPNPMPESVRDRCTKSHEYLFLLAKNERYFYDADAIAEPVSPSMLAQIEQGYSGHATKDFEAAGAQDASAVKSRILGNRASWRGSTFDDGKTGEMKHTRGGLKAATSPRRDGNEWNENNGRGFMPNESHTRNKRSVWSIPTSPYPGAHFATFPPDLIEPCILAGSRPGDTVLDCFFGSGTTGEVAQRLGRQWLGIELNGAYESLQKRRTAQQGLVLA